MLILLEDYFPFFFFSDSFLPLQELSCELSEYLNKSSLTVFKGTHQTFPVSMNAYMSMQIEVQRKEFSAPSKVY
jgi:hypothetical protein